MRKYLAISLAFIGTATCLIKSGVSSYRARALGDIIDNPETFMEIGHNIRLYHNQELAEMWTAAAIVLAVLTVVKVASSKSR